jgi:DNA-directed RNA polymerase specialized sigma24 family protein
MLGNLRTLSDNGIAWTFAANSFDRLLAEFDADCNSVGSAYERLRLRLIHFFEWHGCAFPEELTDETFDRVARGLAQGAIVTSLPNYCFGAARRLFWEVVGRQDLQSHHVRPERQGQNLTAQQPPTPTQQTREEDQFRALRLACLEADLRQLAPADRKLMRQYYQTDNAKVVSS